MFTRLVGKQSAGKVVVAGRNAKSGSVTVVRVVYFVVVSVDSLSVEVTEMGGGLLVSVKTSGLIQEQALETRDSGYWET